MPSINTKCPHCEREITIVENMQSLSDHLLHVDNTDGTMRLRSQWNVCPNKTCNKTILSVVVHKVAYHHGTYAPTDMVPILRRRLIPGSAARIFPDYVPAAIREDYEEACAIVADSPKAAATLARRALQGIVRDFYSVNPGNLIKEIEQLEDKIDEDIWAAIDAVRQIGNIGAHMEKDIDVIVAVDEGESELLIQLVETLIDDCYIARHKRKNRLAGIKALGEAKKAEQKQAKEAKEAGTAKAIPTDDDE